VVRCEGSYRLISAAVPKESEVNTDADIFNVSNYLEREVMKLRNFFKAMVLGITFSAASAAHAGDCGDWIDTSYWYTYTVTGNDGSGTGTRSIYVSSLEYRAKPCPESTDFSNEAGSKPAGPTQADVVKIIKAGGAACIKKDEKCEDWGQRMNNPPKGICYAIGVSYGVTAQRPCNLAVQEEVAINNCSNVVQCP
jgi:hypothetical protein